MAEVAKPLIRGADRIDRIDSKSMQPSETLGLLATLKLNEDNTISMPQACLYLVKGGVA
ncbi:MAG: hypothetical protein K0Q48_1206 [Bacillota bacterium]|nr:hypothetical protein [Bacillota bacterium]